jgi:putative restriction endonuclease
MGLLEEGHGSGSLAEMRERIGAFRRRIHYVQEGPLTNIGCILLIQPTFFERDAWVPQPRDWHPRTVTNKGYDLSTGEGRRIWQACLERAAGQSAISSTTPSVHESISRYGAPYPFAPRLGQGTFRIAVTEAYQRACAVTAEHSLPALEAAHIRSFAQEGPHEIRNGLLLRADLHRLFDQGYLTVAPDHRLEVSRRLREDYHNGRSYYPLHGQVLRLPASVEDSLFSQGSNVHERYQVRDLII